MSKETVADIEAFSKYYGHLPDTLITPLPIMPKFAVRDHIRYGFMNGRVSQREEDEYDLKELKKKLDTANKCLEKVVDPRKIDHLEPNEYTQLGCLAHMANECLKITRD